MTKSEQIEHAHKFLEAVFSPDDIIEIRGLGDAPISRLFRDKRLAAKTAVTLNMKHAGNIYFTLNALDPASATVQGHAIDQPAVSGRLAAKDADISHRNLYLIDFDPVREGKQPSSEREWNAALKLATEVRDFLRKMKWPEPIVISSGNGVHLLFKADGCPAPQPDWRFALGYIAKRFSTPQIQIDKSVTNAARISRLPGCWNRKGSANEERPHRIAQVLEMPQTLEPLTSKRLLDFTIFFGVSDSTHKTKQDRTLVIDEDGVLDLIEEFADILILERVTHRGDITYFAFDECPFKEGQHRGQRVGAGKSALILTPNNLGFKCFSDECTDHGIGDLLRLLRERTGRGPSMDIWEDEWDIEEAFERFEVEEPRWWPEISEKFEEFAVDTAGVKFGDISEYFSYIVSCDHAHSPTPDALKAWGKQVWKTQNVDEVGRYLGRKFIERCQEGHRPLKMSELECTFEGEEKPCFLS